MNNEIKLDHLLENIGVKAILSDNSIDGLTAIAVNKPKEIWVKNRNGWVLTKNNELTFELLSEFAKEFAKFNNKELNSEFTMCHGVLPNGLGCQIVIPPTVGIGTIAIAIEINAIN